MRVHHKNLISLVGYFKDGTNTGLIYEYMDNRNLREHLSGLSHWLELIFFKFSGIRLINDKERTKLQSRFNNTKQSGHAQKSIGDKLSMLLTLIIFCNNIKVVSPECFPFQSMKSILFQDRYFLLFAFFYLTT